MIKFGSDNIIVGFIKNLLAEFKLPTPKVYTYNINDYAVDGQIYIKDDYICQYNEKINDFIQLFRFESNSIPNNYYKKLRFTGINYDSHSHEYLGEYLRFIRDYKGLNLMSLYNCYSNNSPKSIYARIVININDDKTEDDIIIDSTDSNYKLIMLPVKVDKKYTIAIDNSIPYEMFCGLYDTRLIATSNDETIWSRTFMRVGGSKYSSPILYNKLDLNNFYSSEDKKLYNYIKQNEDMLKLFIKLPITNNSSITVLEGNYLNCNDWCYGLFNDNLAATESNIDIFKKKNNKAILNFNPDFQDYDGINNPVPEVKYAEIIKSSLQLLEMNTNVSYPFADRLVEYLVDNVITPLDSIPENIKRLQWLLLQRYREGKKTTGIPTIGKNYGIWDDKYVAILYQLAIEENLLNTKTDLLGYVDKDIEAKIGRYVDLQEKEGK